MTELLLPPSPQWYCGSIIDINRQGTVVYGARHDVIILDTSKVPPRYKGQCCLHRERVSSVVLSPSSDQESLCCSSSEDGKVKLWSTEAPQEVLNEHSQHTCKVHSISWSPVDTDLVVSGDESGQVVTWRHSENRLASFCPVNTAVICLKCSSIKPHHVAIGYKTGVILIFDIKTTGQVLQRLRGHDEEVQSLSWCPIPGEEFRDREQNEMEMPAQDGSGDSRRPAVDFGTEGHLLVSGSKDKTIRIWSTSKGRQLKLFKLPKPQVIQSREELSKARMWISVLWCSKSPLNLISSSYGGELLLWNLASADKDNCQVLSLGDRRLSHNRTVFSIAVGGPSDNLLCSVSMDRQMILWDTVERKALCSVPTLGGFVYVARTSPVDPGRVAIGVGDNMIRVWNQNNTSNMLDVTSFWQGIKSKVTALCWHPVKEGLLAYGTDDGRVGVYDTLSNKPPSISSHYHKRTVYVVAWGPDCSNDENSGTTSNVLYSVGDGVILSHDVHKLQSEAKDINKVIQQTNGKKTRTPIRSEISWNPDYSLVAVGNDDGSVEIFRPPTLQLVCTVHTHHKIVNSIQWHPYQTTVSPYGTSFKYYIATGSNEASVHVVDLESILVGNREEEETVLVTQAKFVLLGHSNRIIAVQWSPHHDNQLASVSYDGVARVWDIDTGQCIASYHGHRGRILCAQWSELEVDMLYTGGEDFSFQKWKTSDHPPKQIDKSVKRKKTKSKRKPVKEADLDVNLDQSEVEALEQLVQERKKELSNQQNQDSQDPPTGVTEPSEPLTTEQGKEAGEGHVSQTLDEQTSNVQQVEPLLQNEFRSKRDTRPDAFLGRDGKKKKPFKPKSMFPLAGRHENRGKESVLADILLLAKSIKAENEETIETPLETSCEFVAEDSVSLGFFLPGKRAIFQCLDLEGQYHRENENMDYFYQLEIWKGNINVALQIAREREELSDWLVAMAPMDNSMVEINKILQGCDEWTGKYQQSDKNLFVQSEGFPRIGDSASFESWTTTCKDYATQLENEGHYHKAATYLLAAHKVYDAIELFRRHRLYKEAIALAKVRLSPMDPVLKELYKFWAHQLSKDGNFEQAAKCHLALHQVQDAAGMLARRYNCNSSLQMAAKISLVAGQKQQGVAYAYKLMQQYLMQYEWQNAYQGLQEEKSLQGLLAVSGLHELTIQQIVLANKADLPVDGSKFSKLQANSKVILPDFILDLKDTDPISPWKPSSVDGHAFPHHVLRIWYSAFGVAMDTASLEEMYNTLNLLNAGRQVQAELPQMLVQVSMDLTLCLLSFLLSETPTAISHLLQTVCNLHEAGHDGVMEIILRLFLPQGPKYVFKLQQEVTAMRVMISMENRSDFDGTSRFHTLKRHLSEQRDEESSVSCSRPRCREIDCLKAYYFLAVLKYLLDNYCSVSSVKGATGTSGNKEHPGDTGTQGNTKGDDKVSKQQGQEGAIPREQVLLSSQEKDDGSVQLCNRTQSSDNDGMFSLGVSECKDQNHMKMTGAEVIVLQSQNIPVDSSQVPSEVTSAGFMGDEQKLDDTTTSVDISHSVTTNPPTVNTRTERSHDPNVKSKTPVQSEVFPDSEKVQSDSSIVKSEESENNVVIASVSSKLTSVGENKESGNGDGAGDSVEKANDRATMSDVHVDKCSVEKANDRATMSDVHVHKSCGSTELSDHGDDVSIPGDSVMTTLDRHGDDTGSTVGETCTRVLTNGVMSSHKATNESNVDTKPSINNTDVELQCTNSGSKINSNGNDNVQTAEVTMEMLPPSICEKGDSQNDVGGQKIVTDSVRDGKTLKTTNDEILGKIEKSQSIETDSSNVGDPSISNFENLKHLYDMTILRLRQLSQGLLWDVQGKRFAYTKTLNFIEKAISQLSISSAQAKSVGNDRDIMLSPWECHDNSSTEKDQSVVHASNTDKGSDQSNRSRSNVPLYGQGEGHSSQLYDGQSQLWGNPTGSSDQSPYTDASVIFDSIGDLCASEFGHKSRKVLFRDQSRSHSGFETVEKGSSTNIINPAKYINVPDEWYSMSADQKYFMPYVTMAILKEEQEFMIHELKRGSDIVQAPFPNPIDSVILLHNVGKKCICEESGKKEEILQGMVSWGLRFAVSTQQKYVLTDLNKNVSQETEDPLITKEN